MRLVILLSTALAALHVGVFAQSAGEQGPVVPDVKAFQAEIRDNLARAQRATHLFSYKERRTKVHTNPFGKLGTDGIELFEVYPSIHSRLTYRRALVRDGHTLSAEELAQQDREYLARSAGVRRRLRDETAADRRSRLDAEVKARRRAEALIEDIIASLTFTVTGRAVYEGSPAITVAFAGIPTARPKTREGKIAQKFTGTAWIHADLHEVMHVEATSTDEVSFGLGMIAKLNRDTKGSLTRRPIAPGIWLPTEVRLSGDGRAVLQLRKLVLDFAVDWFDYEPFDGTVPVAQ